MKKRLLQLLIVMCIMACATLALVGCGGPALDAPISLATDDAVTMLTWDSVVGARGYKVEIKGDNGYEDLVDIKRVSFGISNLETRVTYTFRVKAVGDKVNFSDSEWSEEYTVFKPYENGMIFKSINGSTEYEVINIGSATRTTNEVEIPATYRNKPVTSIGAAAFFNNSRVTKIVIPDSVTSIGERAFRNCVALEEMVIPNSVISIGSSAFQNCTSLKTVKISNSLVELPNNAFYGCSKLSTVEFGTSLKVIGENAFFNCRKLGSIETVNEQNHDDVTVTYVDITIPNSVEEIGFAAFAKCSAIKKVKLGENVITIGAEAFKECSNIEQVTSNAKLETIGNSAFESCTKLTSFTLPNSTISLGDYAFSGCVLLGDVTLSENLETIGRDAFGGTIYWASASEGELIYVGDWLVGAKFPALEDTTNPIWQEVSVLNIEEGTIGIAAYGLYTGVSMKMNGEEQVIYASLVREVNIPSSVRSIGKSAFQDNLNLVKVTIGDQALGGDLALIDAQAFYNCDVLDTFLIYSNKLERIGDQAFAYCERLGLDAATNTIREIYFPDTLRTIGSYAFKNTHFETQYSGAVYVGGWIVGQNSSDITSITIDAVRNGIPVVGISNYGLYNKENTTLAQVALPSSLKYIGKSAFYKCRALTSITIPAGVEEIKEYTFCYCDELRTINLGNVSKIGEYAFYKCGVGGVEIDDGTSAPSEPVATITGLENVVSVGNYAFYKNEYVKSITLGENLTSVGRSAFNGMGITSLNIPASLTTIPEYAFANNVSLASLTISEGVTDIGRYAFSNTAITSLTLPSTVETIGDYAFRKCHNLAELNLNEGLESIGKSAFVECYGLTSLSIPESVVALGNMAFRSCTGLTSVILNDTVETMGMHVFYGSKVTFYTAMTEIPASWSVRWNSSNRPIFFGCTFSNDGEYVVSFTKSAETLHMFTINKPTVDEEGNEVEAKDPIRAPYREGYEFLGWATIEDGDVQFDASEVYLADENTVLYAIWDEIVPEVE
ncbi:MAG: leucine-rich repeat protein [Clostridia bacterium]|nr:leucine-rich repeat protein [Clostridia bacterium]